MFTQDFREFVSLLNAHSVEYLVVGGYAVGLHGYSRFTGDLDVWVRPSLDNSRRTVSAINAFGFDSLGLGIDVFSQGRRIFHMGRRPVQIDVMNAVDGIEFEPAYRNRVVLEIDGLLVPFVGLTELKQNKRAAARPKDLEDLRNLP